MVKLTTGNTNNNTDMSFEGGSGSTNISLDSITGSGYDSFSERNYSFSEEKESGGIQNEAIRKSYEETREKISFNTKADLSLLKILNLPDKEIIKTLNNLSKKEKITYELALFVNTDLRKDYILRLAGVKNEEENTISEELYNTIIEYERKDKFREDYKYLFDTIDKFELGEDLEFEFIEGLIIQSKFANEEQFKEIIFVYTRDFFKKSNKGINPGDVIEIFDTYIHSEIIKNKKIVQKQETFGPKENHLLTNFNDPYFFIRSIDSNKIDLEKFENIQKDSNDITTDDVNEIINTYDAKKIKTTYIKDRVIGPSKEYDISEITLNEKSNNSGSYSITLGGGVVLNNIPAEEYKNLGIKEKLNKETGKTELDIGNPEALKNLINLKETLMDLNLEFIWDSRQAFYTVMREKSGFAEINNEDSDNVSKQELHNLLNFILKVIGEEQTLDEEAAKKRIRQINGGWMSGNKKDTFTELGTIGQIFKDKKYYDPHNGLHVINEELLKDESNWKKIEK